MYELKWKYHRSENFFGDRSKQTSVKEELGGPIGNRTDAVSHYHKTEKKWKRNVKSLRKINRMLFSMANKSGSRHYIKNIKAKSSNEHSYSIINSSSIYLY